MSQRRLSEKLLGLSDAGILLLVVLALLAYAFAYTVPRQWSRGLLINDEMWYAHLARNVWAGNGYVTDTLYPMQAAEVDSFPAPEALKQAAYPLLVALVWAVTGPSARAMVLLGLLGFAVAGGLLYLVGRAFGWGPPAALFLTGLVVLDPSVVMIFTAALPESWYFAVFLLSVLLLLRASPMSVAGCGLAHAALLMLKGHGIIYVPVYLAYLLAAGGPEPTARGLRRSLLGRMRLAAIYGLTLAAGMLAAWALLPSGSVQLFRSGSNYSLAFLIETDRAPADRLPYYELEPPDATEYILEHPAEYAEKYLRMVSRTKAVLTVLGGPAVGGVLFPFFLLSLALLLADVAWPGWILPRAGPGRRLEHLLLIAIIGVTLTFFWAIHLTLRFILHTYPLMLLVVFEVASRLRPLARPLPSRLRATMIGLGLFYTVVYPPVIGIWNAYRDPFALLGRQLAVRFVNYGQVAANVEKAPPGPLVSDMAHEINWHTGRSTIFFPLTAEELGVLVDKYDVTALYEHPLAERDWPWIEQTFRLVDERNGRFWVRRDRLSEAQMPF